VEQKKRIVVGVNRYEVQEPPPEDLLRVDPRVQVEQIASLASVRRSRNAGEVQRALSALKKGAEGTDNLLPLILDAVRAYAGIGEICDTLRGVFGEYRERIVI
jgi:methylmalonyl-CoA mutase N-terminal domain/subunit